MSDRSVGDERPRPGLGGVVLCGGQSRRMGIPKAQLPFGRECMLARVVRLLSQAVSPVVVVAAPDQPLPPLASQVVLVRDDRPGRGPLEGIHSGLAALSSRAEAAYVTGCDVPLLVPDFVRLLARHLADHQIVVPMENDYPHPLAAIYRLSVRDAVRQLLQQDQLRPAFLFQQVDTRQLPVSLLQPADPQLLTLRNLNTPQDYLDALQLAGLTAPAEILARLSRSQSAQHR